MRHLSRHYQVKIIQTNGHEPMVQGVEAINVNGRRRVRRFDETTAWPTEDWFDDWSALSDAAFKFDPTAPWWDELPAMPARAPRRIQVEPIAISDRSSASPFQAGWQHFQQALRNTAHKVTQIVRNIPAAWQAAWRELNR